MEGGVEVSVDEGWFWMLLFAIWEEFRRPGRANTGQAGQTLPKEDQHGPGRANSAEAGPTQPRQGQHSPGRAHTAGRGPTQPGQGACTRSELLTKLASRVYADATSCAARAAYFLATKMCMQLGAEVRK